MRPVRFLLLVSILSLATSAFAQIPPSSGTTSTPIPGAGHDYIGGFNETVNPAGGSVSVRIRVIIPPGRGITLPFSFAYDSGGVYYLENYQGSGVPAWATTTSRISQGGWSNTAPVMRSQTSTSRFGIPDGLRIQQTLFSSPLYLKHLIAHRDPELFHPFHQGAQMVATFSAATARLMELLRPAG